MQKIAVLIVCENSAVNLIEPSISRAIDNLKQTFSGLVKVATYHVEEVPRDFAPSAALCSGFLATIDNPVICRKCGAHQGNH